MNAEFWITNAELTLPNAILLTYLPIQSDFQIISLGKLISECIVILHLETHLY